MPRKYWSIQYYNTGSGLWTQDTRIPRAGVDPFTRTSQSTNNFVTLADGSIAVSTNENKSNWQEIELIFPRQVVTTALRSQLLGYVDNNRGIRIEMPLTSGSSSYTSRQLEGYIIKYEEQYHPGDATQEYTINITMQEFDVDADSSP